MTRRSFAAAAAAPVVRTPSAKDKPIQFMVTQETWERVNGAAHDQRITMSEFVRRAVDEKLERGRAAS